MSRRNGHRNADDVRRIEHEPRPGSIEEIQAASLSSPYFRASWSRSSRLSWQQFMDRWECRFQVPAPRE